MISAFSLFFEIPNLSVRVCFTIWLIYFSIKCINFKIRFKNFKLYLVLLGDFKDSDAILRWLRSHEEVVTWVLTDDNFEDYTDSYSPDEGALDWFVML